MPFRVALSGLNAASTDLNVTANNIANANTLGFKGSRAEFSDVFAVGAAEIGNGARLANVSQSFSQGGIDFTDRSLDLALSGEGFFTVSDNGAIVYSRVGAFGVDRDGVDRPKSLTRRKVVESHNLDALLARASAVRARRRGRRVLTRSILPALTLTLIGFRSAANAMRDRRALVAGHRAALVRVRVRVKG